MDTRRARRAARRSLEYGALDRAARIAARYRIDYEIADTASDPFGPEPADADQRRDYGRVERARNQLDRELGRDVSGPQLDPF